MIVFVSSFLISLIPLALESQDTAIKSILSTILIFIWLICSLAMGIPSLRNDMVARMSKGALIGILVSLAVIPYGIMLVLGLDLLSTLAVYSIYYLIPTAIFVALIARYETIKQWQRLLVAGSGALLYWIGFDHRYTSILFEPLEGLSYIMNSFWIVSLMMISYGAVIGIKQVDVEADEALKPTLEGFKLAQIASIGISIIIVPAGLLTGFLSWNPQLDNAVDIVIGFIGIYLTIAFQEELVFRGILLQEADLLAKDHDIHHLIPLLITSVMFGLTHWNNETLTYVPHYIILATVAGIGYGWAYRKGGMFAAMITHTLVDWVWSLLLLRA